MAAAYEDRVEVLTDGAIYEDDGTIISLRQKIWKSDKLPLVFAGRGNAIAVDMMSTALSFFAMAHGTFDETFMAFKDKIEARADKGKDQVAVDAVFTGISESLGPVIYYFHTYQEGSEGFYGCEPFKFYDAGKEIAAGPTPPPRAMRDSGLPMYWAFDGLEGHGKTFMGLLRQHPMEHLAHPDKPLVYGVGGHVDHTVVTADGVTIKRLHVWPEDQIGRKIEPHSAECAECTA